MKNTFSSTVDGITFPYELSDNRSYARHSGLRGIALIKFWLKIFWGYGQADKRLAETLKLKKCYYGAFKGEFGHFLAHTLPFLAYLHKHGVQIIYCGMELHKPFMVDDKGDCIISDFRKLRDFFSEVTPKGNSTVPPMDVQKEIENFENEAKLSAYPFWNISENYYYWFIHRNWLLKGHTFSYSLEKHYSSMKENSCVIFPRSKGAKSSHNNGEAWDYPSVIESVAPYFDKIYLCGHPTQVLNLDVSNPKVEIAVSTDNAVMLNKVSNSRLIITQHSGIVYVGEYTGTDILLIYKGGKQIQDIGSFNNTLRFKKQFNSRSKIHFAFTQEEIISKIKELNN